MDHVKDLNLVCLMLLDIFPNLDIRGVDYLAPKMLEGTEHEHLLEDIETINLLPAGSRKDGKRKDTLEKNKSENN